MKTIYHQIGRDAHYKIWNAPEENMIIFFHKGSGSLVFQDAIYPIEGGAICFIKGAKQRYTMPDNPAVYDRSKIYLSPDKTNMLLSALGCEGEFYKLFSDSSVVYATLPENKRALAEAYFEKAKADEDKTFADASFLLSFFALMGMVFEYKQHNIGAPDGPMARVVKYINQHYAEGLQLDVLSKNVNLSKSHLCHLFKRTMGATPSEYILKTRLAAAKGLLISTDLAVGEISDRCGFSSVSYFCQAFAAKHGTTAREYRKKYASGERIVK